MELQADWEHAALTAQAATQQFGRYTTLIQQAAFCWLCTGNAVAADAVLQASKMKSYVGDPLYWLKAFTALRIGNPQVAEIEVELYLGRLLNAAELLTETLLLGFWYEAATAVPATALVHGFPLLPPEITGLPVTVTRLAPDLLNPSRYDVQADLRPLVDTTAAPTIKSVSPESSNLGVEPTLPPITTDNLIYTPENQPWYAAQFPTTNEVEAREFDTLSDEIDVVMITATDVELWAVMHLLNVYGRRRAVLCAYAGPETYYLGMLGRYRTVVTKCRMGAIGEGSVILATEQAQRLWRPRVIIMVGIAFGKDPAKQHMADVLVASQIISYEQQRVGAEIIYRGAIPPSNSTLLNRFENVRNWTFLRPDGRPVALRTGPILSGEKLVDDPVFKAQLFTQFPQAIGGEMEGAGLCAASGRMGVPWILVKAICDWGDGQKHNQHQALAAAAAASLVQFVLMQKTVLNSLEKQAR